MFSSSLVLIYGAEWGENEVSSIEVGCRHIYGIHSEELSAIRGAKVAQLKCEESSHADA